MRRWSNEFNSTNCVKWFNVIGLVKAMLDKDLKVNGLVLGSDGLWWEIYCLGI